MRIKGWSINGFGVFHDFDVPSLSRGMTVFWGPNEAGKTTLLAFLRGMLFGFPEGDRGKNHYPPLNGGNHGGRLELEATSGSITIERRLGRLAPPRITLPDGSAGTEADLRRLLGGVNERLFSSVFAFSLAELQAFNSLSNIDVREHLFSAAITGAGRFARKTIRALEHEAEGLLPSSGESRIAALAQEISRVRDRISRTRKTLARYPDLQAREAKSRQQAVDLESRVEELRQEIGRKHLLIEAWPTYSEITAWREELEFLEPIDSFPAEAEARLAAIDEKIAGLQAEIEHLRSERERTAEQRTRIAATVDRNLADLDDPIDHLHETLGIHRQRFQQLTDSGDQLKRQELAMSRALDSIGRGWDEDKLRGFDPDGTCFEQTREWKDQLTSGQQQLEGARNAFHLQANKVRELIPSRERAALELARAEPPTIEELDAREAASHRLRTNYGELRAEETALESLESSINEAELTLEEVSSRKVRRLPATVVAFCFVVAIVGLVGAFLQSQAVVPFLLLALLGTVSGIACLAVLLQSRKAESSRIVEQKHKEHELNSLRESAWKHRRTIDGLRKLLAEDAALVRIRGDLTFASIEERDWEIQRARQDREAWDKQSRELQHLSTLLDREKKEEDRRADLLIAEEERRRSLEHSWRQWKKQQGLTTALSPEQVFALLNQVTVARKCLADLDATRELRAAVEKKTSAWERKVLEVLERSGQNGNGDLGGGALIARFITLHQRSLEDRESRRRLALEEKQLEERNGWIHARELKLKAASKEQQQLFGKAGARDAADFHDRHRIYLRRRELESKISESDSRLNGQLGHGESAVRYREMLFKGSPDNWHKTIEEIKHRIEQFTLQRDTAIRKHRDAERERKALEESTELADLELEEQSLITELHGLANTWRGTVLTSQLLLETLNEFERTRQPRVIAEASGLLKAITGGRYVELRQSEGDDDLIAVDSRGARRPTGTLSRGTAEQLYLSLRLSLIREYVRGNLMLPLIMDDVLVNFDPERAEAMGRALCDFATDHQIILFTCQPQTFELLEKISDQTTVLRLEGLEPEEGIKQVS